ncbi:MAG: TRAP transporter substrate-binding protein [Eubacteriales bacterium]|jgi:tripartite ATP-independent transporter DctP family solute receptor
MKKILASVLVCMMAASMLTGCGGDSSTNTSTSTGGDTSTSTSNQQTQEDPFEIVIATGNVPEHCTTKGYQKMIDVVNAESNGRIVFDLKHSGQLGAQRDYIEGMQMGTIQMGEVNTAVLTSLDENFVIFDLPYLIKDMDTCIEVLNSGIGDKLSQSLEEKANLCVVGWQVFIPRSVYSAKAPINTPEDLVGLKIRTQEAPAIIKAFELLGAKPTPIPSNEKYMALQTGVVDAAENSPSVVLYQKDYEVTKYLSYTEHQCAPNAMVMDANFFNSMPEDLQALMLKGGKEGGALASQIEKDELADIEKQLVDLGMVINEVEDKQAFIDIVKPVYDEYKDKIDPEIFEAFSK